MNKASPPIFECHDVTVRYGSIVALSDVGAVFERGKIHAVVGQNGAGKRPSPEFWLASFVQHRAN